MYVVVHLAHHINKHNERNIITGTIVSGNYLGPNLRERKKRRDIDGPSPRKKDGKYDQYFYISDAQGRMKPSGFCRKKGR